MNMNDLAQRVAVHLPGWKSVENDNDLVGILQRSDGAQMHLRLRNNRVEVSGAYPVGRAFGSPDPTITVSAQRPPRDIAADIKRRFLPEYDKLFAECLAAAEQDRRYLQQKVDDTQRLARLLGLRYEPPADPRDVQYLSWSVGEVYCRIRSEHGNVYLDRVSMPIALFEQLVPIISAWTGQ